MRKDEGAAVDSFRVLLGAEGGFRAQAAEHRRHVHGRPIGQAKADGARHGRSGLATQLGRCDAVERARIVSLNWRTLPNPPSGRRKNVPRSPLVPSAPGRVGW